MSLIVEDGTGKADAESYVSVADAAVILANYGRSSAWDALGSDAEREAALRNATMYIEEEFVDSFDGYVLREEQALLWPRKYATDINGYELPQSEVPDLVKRACAFAADEHLSQSVYADSDNGSLIASESKGLGSGALSKSVTYVGGKSTQFTSKSAEMALSKLIHNDGLEVYRS